MPPTIRPGHPAEADALSELAIRAKASWGYPAAWLDEWAPQLRFTASTFQECEVIVADEGGRIGGVIALAFDSSEDSGQIEHLWVDPEAQGRGVGRALVGAGLEAAREAGLVCLRIESDPGARTFYERLGAVYQGEVAAPVQGDPQRALPVLRLEVGVRPGEGAVPGPTKATWTGIGVDGCRAGWLAIRLWEGGWEGRVFSSIAELDEAWGGPATLTLVDIPIGLPDDTSFRACDAEARRVLGRRSSSVFNPPTRAALAAGSYVEAADLNEAACGKRLSKQTWYIMPKIAEVDGFIRSAPDLQDRVREAHPETLFQVLNAGEPLRHRKKETEGRGERLTVLEGYLPGAEQIFEGIRARVPRKEAALDDVVDALAGALTAFRFADSLRTLPDHPERDDAGLRCEMVVPRIQIQGATGRGVATSRGRAHYRR